jgi:hypothetical protein
MEKKNELTSEIRSAGITNQDQDFMDSFSETMTTEKVKEQKPEIEYTPSDKEVQ